MTINIFQFDPLFVGTPNLFGTVRRYCPKMFDAQLGRFYFYKNLNAISLSNGTGAMENLGTVLIVDDDPVQQKTLVTYFESRNLASCLVANNGDEAANFVKNNSQFGLITCDLNMPDNDGIEFLEFLVSSNYIFPIVIITSARQFVSESALMLAKAHNLNVLGMIKKPATASQLTRIIAPILYE